MKKLIVLIGILGVAVFGHAPPADIPQTTIRTATHMVVVDVIVSDKAGNAVTGLQSTDFSVNEDGKAQKIAAFRFETPRPAESRSLPTLPPHIYTNRIGYKAPAGPLTMIVLDGVNTALRDQLYARQQLLKYLKTQLKPNQHIAVFVLTGQLHLLQDINSDPELLLSKVEHFLAQDPRGLSIEQESMQPFRHITSATPNDRGVGFREFQGMMLERGAVAYDARVSETLSAFRTIASVVGGYSGRKNLIWISSAFPAVFMADSSMFANGAQRIFLDSSMHAEARATAQRLAQAQIAVYPVDPRGLVGAAVEDASRDLKDPSGHSYAGGDFAQQMNRSNSGLLSSQGTMEDVAKETGGVGYMNQNEISHAVAASIADGSSYYSLAYYPSNKDWNEKFRSIQVKVGRSDVRLRYRRGYYAADPLVSSHRSKATAEADLASALQGEFVGATSVVFDARVVPPAPAAAASVRVPVEFLVNTDTISCEPTANEGRHFILDFHVSAFTPDGKLATHVDKTFEATATAADYERVRQHGLPLQTSVDLPAGHYQLRLIIRDGRTGSMGSVEFPLELSQAATAQ
jgi:VWFA-related protein